MLKKIFFLVSLCVFFNTYSVDEAPNTIKSKIISASVSILINSQIPANIQQKITYEASRAVVFSLWGLSWVVPPLGYGVTMLMSSPNGLENCIENISPYAKPMARIGLTVVTYHILQKIYHRIEAFRSKNKKA